MVARFTESELLSFLQKIETGEITLEHTGSRTPADIYAGDVQYRASNGWLLTVFNDCNEWDYIDAIQRGGTRVDYDALSKHYPRVAQYSPPDEVARRAYGIPGYLKGDDPWAAP